MSQWWSGLNLRERLLIGAAAALSVLLLLWQVVFVPITQDKAAARAQLETTSMQLDRLLDGYAQKRAAGTVFAVSTTQQVSLSADAFKGAVTREAADKGLSISRLQGDGDPAMTLVFERVPPQQFFYWLQSVETGLGGRVARLTLEQAGEGNVRVSVELERQGS